MIKVELNPEMFPGERVHAYPEAYEWYVDEKGNLEINHVNEEKVTAPLAEYARGAWLRVWIQKEQKSE